MTSRGNYFMTNVRQLDSIQHMCRIVLSVEYKYYNSTCEIRVEFQIANIVHLSMEGLNLVAFKTRKRFGHD
jgi:hypothetical protein